MQTGVDIQPFSVHTLKNRINMVIDNKQTSFLVKIYLMILYLLFVDQRTLFKISD